MAISQVNTGASPNDNTGDPLRTAFTKLNDSIADLALRTGPATDLGSISPGGAINLNPAGAREGVFAATLTGAHLINPSNIPAGVIAVYLLYLRQDATGGRSVTFPGGVTTFLNGSDGTLNPAANSVSLVTMVTANGGGSWLVSISDARPNSLEGLMWNPPGNGSYYWRAPGACVLLLNNVGKQGTGTLAFARAPAATPQSFTSASGATAFALGDVLRITVTGFATYLAFDIPRLPA